MIQTLYYIMLLILYLYHNKLFQYEIYIFQKIFKKSYFPFIIYFFIIFLLNNY